MQRIITCLLLLLSFTAQAQKTDRRLQQKLEELVKGFHGDIGIYVHDLKKDKIAAVNADTIFPTASIVKIPILIGIMDKMERGELQYHQQLTYKDSLFYSEGDDVLSSLKNDATIELSKLLLLMISFSDNCASLWLQGLAGTGTRINQILDSIGLQHTRVNSRTPGREANRTQYGWGQTTPYEMAGIMQKIVQGQILTKASSEQMLRILSRQFWDEHALSQIPPGIFTADKTGAVDGSRDEILYVNGTHPYILSIFTKNNKDVSWDNKNEAWVMIQKVSALLNNYFNPRSNRTGATIPK